MRRLSSGKLKDQDLLEGLALTPEDVDSASGFIAACWQLPPAENRCGNLS
jgi:hypothetical protein